MRASKMFFMLLLLYGCTQQSSQQQKGMQQSSRQANNQHKDIQDTIPLKATTPPDSLLITLMLPKDIKKYEKAMTNYTNDGGVDPSVKWPFTPSQLNVPYTADSLKASAAAAAKVLSTQADSVVYFRVKDKTAYILLEMDVNGWAGVTYTIRKVHPIVERTLLRFPEINQVKFSKP